MLLDRKVGEIFSLFFMGTSIRLSVHVNDFIFLGFFVSGIDSRQVSTKSVSGPEMRFSFFFFLSP